MKEAYGRGVMRSRFSHVVVSDGVVMLCSRFKKSINTIFAPYIGQLKT